MGGLSGLLRMDEVKKEINATDEQIAEINTFADEARSGLDFRSLGRDSTEEQRNEFMLKVQASMEKIDAKLSEVLDPVQFDRLVGLYAQQAGPSALSNKLVAEAAGLSEETKAKLKAKQDELRQQGFGGFGGRGGRGRPEGDRPPEGGRPEGDRGFGGDFNPDEMRAQMEKMRKERDDALLELLTEEERANFEKLKGEKFEFPAFGGFGGGFGGRGGRGGPGGERPEGNN